MERVAVLRPQFASESDLEIDGQRRTVMSASTLKCSWTALQVRTLSKWPRAASLARMFRQDCV